MNIIYVVDEVFAYVVVSINFGKYGNILVLIFFKSLFVVL